MGVVISLAAAINGRRAGGVTLVSSMTRTMAMAMAMVFSCFFSRIMMIMITFMIVMPVMIM